MSDYSTLAILAAFLFLYSANASRLEKTIVNGALVFTGFGIVCGPLGLNILTVDPGAEGLRTLAEWTLALVLFSDAAKANLGVLKPSLRLPERLLLIGLPLTIALGFGAGVLVLDGLTLLELAIVATMLAPTDAALGQAVVTNPAVPAKVRESLNVESGLNDGICVPVLFIFLAIATNKGGDEGMLGLASRLIVEEIGIGAVVGLAVASIASAILKRTISRGWVADSWLPIPVVAIAMTCFATAQSLGGSGFIASFVGGLTFGAMVKDHKEQLLSAAEGTGDTFSLLTWVAFGAAVVGHSIDHFSWRIVVYAVLSLTVVRMLPVFLVLTGTGLGTKSKLFMGWFGPRGLASIVFLIIVLGDDLPGAHIIAMTVVFTVMLSVLAHGLTANPLASAYGASVKDGSE
jgi:NhaP-type Na+/H+ or K+/H+ antiporter